jgi:transcriptional regulator with XRE-family HTH domain
MKQLPYSHEAWYGLLLAACQRETRARIAERLGVSPSVVTQVLNGSGLYGTGQASTARLAAKVLHKFGSYVCPHLTAMFAEERHISAAECRTHAHAATAPIGSPGQLAHWRACSTCEHKPQTAPAAPRPVRKRKGKTAEPAPPAAAAPAIPVNPVTHSTQEHHDEVEGVFQA